MPTRKIRCRRRSARCAKSFPARTTLHLPEGPFEDAGKTIIMGIEGAAAFRDLIRSGKVAQLADPLGQISGYVSEQLGGADYVRAQQIRGVLQQKMADLFDSFDVLVAASQPLGANAIDANLETDLDFPDPLGGIGNLCGRLPRRSRSPAAFYSWTRICRSDCNSSPKPATTFAAIRAARAYQQHTECAAPPPPEVVKLGFTWNFRLLTLHCL